MSRLHLPRVVGLHGLAQTGKDTLGRMLVEQYGYRRIAFADVLREAVWRLNPIVATDNQGRIYRLQEVVEDLGWEGAKPAFNNEVRGLLDRMGTEVGREMFGENFWVEMATRPIEYSLSDPGNEIRYVITDVRFPNEIDYVASLRPYGYLLKIQRPGVTPISNHPAHQEQPNHLFDSVILNDDTPEYLLETAIMHMRAGR